MRGYRVSGKPCQRGGLAEWEAEHGSVLLSQVNWLPGGLWLSAQIVYRSCGSGRWRNMRQGRAKRVKLIDMPAEGN